MSIQDKLLIARVERRRRKQNAREPLQGTAEIREMMKQIRAKRLLGVNTNEVEIEGLGVVSIDTGDNIVTDLERYKIHLVYLPDTDAVQTHANIPARDKEEARRIAEVAFGDTTRWRIGSIVLRQRYRSGAE
jgi:hypothetical protein